MDVAELQAYCLAKPGAWPDNPWDHEHPVMKVGEGAHGKIFAFLGADGVGVKGGPTREVADEWLDRFPGKATVMAYIGRSGWNSLSFDIPTTSCSRRSTSRIAWSLRSFPGVDGPPAGMRDLPTQQGKSGVTGCIWVIWDRLGFASVRVGARAPLPVSDSEE